MFSENFSERLSDGWVLGENAFFDNAALVAPEGATIELRRVEKLSAFDLNGHFRLPADGSRLSLTFAAGEGAPTNALDYQLVVARSGEQTMQIEVTLQHRPAGGGRWQRVTRFSRQFGEPADESRSRWEKYAGADTARRWQWLARERHEQAQRRLTLRVQSAGGRLRFWFNGVLAADLATRTDAAGHLVFSLHNRAALERVEARRADPAARYEPLDLSPLYNRDGIAASEAPERGDLGDGTALPAEALPAGGIRTVMAGIPFDMPDFESDTLNVVDVGDSRWLEAADDSYRASQYMHGMEPGDGNPANLRLWLPGEAYRNAYLLCTAADLPETTRTLTVRQGSFSVHHSRPISDTTAEVPAWNATGGPNTVQALELGPMRGARGGQAGRLFVVRVPMNASAIDTLLQRHDTRLTFELTRPIGAALRYPDPAHFMPVPLGPASAVRVLAATLERAPVRMHIVPHAVGNVFEQPASPGFDVELINLTDQPRDVTLALAWAHYFGAKGTHPPQRVQLDPGQTRRVEFVPALPERGHYDLTLRLSDADGEIAQKNTSLVLLAPDERQAGADSPFGVWCFWGTHGFGNYDRRPLRRDETTIDYRRDIMALLRKAGIRYVQHTDHPEFRAFKLHASEIHAPGLWRGGSGEPWPDDTLEQSITAAGEAMRTAGSRYVRMLAENRISIRWLQQLPWWWLNRERPAYTTQEQERLDGLVRIVMPWMKAVHARYPEIRVLLGNDYPLQIEALFHGGVKLSAGDVTAFEAAQFMRMPENPTFLTATSFSHMMKEILERYGHADAGVEIWSTEAFYPSTQPGNLTERTQARYVSRTLLTALSAGVARVAKPFGVYDMSSRYRFSHWGQPGLLREDDEFQPKPAYVAYAVTTRVLDQARYDRKLDTGSAVVYAPVFKRADGRQVTALWTIEGRRPVTLALSGGAGLAVDIMGRETAIQNGAALTLSPDPLYVIGDVTAVQPGEAVYEAELTGRTQILDSLSDPARWTVDPPLDDNLRNLLETGNFENPRNRGNIELDWHAGEAGGPAGLSANLPRLGEADAPLIARYRTLTLKEPVALEGKPLWIGAWVRGNGNWGRIIYHLGDAGGQQWISVGALGRFNCNDPWNFSFIRHDGWRLLRFDLPGDLGGPERYQVPTINTWGHFKWAAGDDGSVVNAGDKYVQHPLRLEKITIEMRDTILYLDERRVIEDNTIMIRDIQVGDDGADWQHVPTAWDRTVN